MILVSYLVTNDNCMQDQLNFNIQASHKHGTLYLVCENGCAWKELSFDLSHEDKPKFIDEFGTAMNEDDMKTNKGLANFHFSFKLDQNKIHCESTLGTHWDTISFECNSDKCYGLISIGGVSVNTKSR